MYLYNSKIVEMSSPRHDSRNVHGLKSQLTNRIVSVAIVWPLDQHCLFIYLLFLTLHNNLAAYDTLVRSFESYQDVLFSHRSLRSLRSDLATLKCIER